MASILNICYPINKTQKLLPKVDCLDFNSEYEKFSQTFRKSVKGDSDYFIFKMSEKTETGTNSDTKASQRASLPKLPLEIKYDYELILKYCIESPICKNKYFQFQVLLKPINYKSYPISSSIELKLDVLTDDGSIISKNMKGSDIVKGGAHKSMHYIDPEKTHVAYFRIQITEGSSHYPSKRLNLLISNPSLYPSLSPLLIPNLKIRAKRSSKF